MIIPESVTFEEAIALTQSLMSQIETASPQETAETVSQLVKTEKGARGFFVTYLTSEGTFADSPSPEVIRALQTSPDIVAELLVKNLAMSTATAITHRRDHNEPLAQGSDKVRRRTTRLIEQLELPKVRKLALKLRESAVTGAGTYKTFLQTWGYDAEQRQVICQALDRILPEFPPADEEVSPADEDSQTTPEMETASSEAVQIPNAEVLRIPDSQL